MHFRVFTTAAVTALFATASLAAPTEPLVPRATPAPVGDSGVFYIYSSTGGGAGTNPDLNVAQIHANSLGFYINRTTTSYCPGSVECPVGNVTVLKSYADGRASMDVSVPGGQQVFIDPTNGNLRFTKAGKKNPPSGALTQTFRYTFYGDNHFSSLTWAPNATAIPAAFGFLACPLKKKGNWIIKYKFDNITYPAGCQAIGLVTSNYTLSTGAAAYEYV